MPSWNCLPQANRVYRKIPLLCTTNSTPDRSDRSCPLLLERESVVVNRLCRKSTSEGVWCYTVCWVPEENSRFCTNSVAAFFSGVSVLWQRLNTRHQVTLSKYLIYRVRQRVYYRTVGRKTQWKPPFFFCTHNNVANVSTVRLEISLETTVLFSVHKKWPKDSTVRLEDLFGNHRSRFCSTNNNQWMTPQQQ
jgi:hypothetical protein